LGRWGVSSSCGSRKAGGEDRRKRKHPESGNVGKGKGWVARGCPHYAGQQMKKEQGPRLGEKKKVPKRKVEKDKN